MKCNSIFANLFLAAAILSVQAADWPTFRGNPARTGFYPDPTGSPKKTAWTASLGCEIVSSPCVNENTLFVGGRDGYIYALDCGTGKIRWKYRTGGWVDASPMVDGDRLIVGSRDSAIYALKKTNGDLLGAWKAGLQLSSPAKAADGSILSGRGLPGGGVAAFPANPLRWERTGPQWYIALPQYTYSSPAVHGQAAVIGATNGKLYGIDTGRRDTLWSLSTGGGVYLSTPSIDDTIVYFTPGDEDRAVYAVSLFTGKPLWICDVSQISADQGLAKKSGTPYLPAVDRSRLMLLRPADLKKAIANLDRKGIPLPRLRIPGANTQRLGKTAVAIKGDFIPFQGAKTSSIAVGNKNMFVVQKEPGYVLVDDSLILDKQRFTLQAIDKKTGKPAWSFGEVRSSSHLGYCSSPVATNQYVFFGWGEGKIYALTADSGQKIWEDSLNGHIVSSPAIAGARLYTATMNGYVYAFDLTETPPGLDFQKSTFCYPNPARQGISHVQVYAPVGGQLNIVIYNSNERPVMTFNSPVADGSKNTYDWILKGVANGVYFAVVKLQHTDGKLDKKILKIAVLN